LHAKTAARLLASAESAGHLIAQAEQLMTLRRLAASVLPVELRRSAAVANVKQGKVVIFAENAAIAAKLRLLEPALLDAFAREALQVTGLQVRVQVPDASKAHPRMKRARLAPGPAASLDRLAKSLPDSELSRAVARLAKRGK
jgi:hypothetical protein